MASNTDDTTSEVSKAHAAAAAGADIPVISGADAGEAAPRKRSTRSLESRQAAAKKAAATRARKKAEAAARLAAESASSSADGGHSEAGQGAVAQGAPVDPARGEPTAIAPAQAHSAGEDAPAPARRARRSRRAVAPAAAPADPSAVAVSEDTASVGQMPAEFDAAPPASTPLDSPVDITAVENPEDLSDPMTDPVVLAAQAGHEPSAGRPVVPSFGLLFQAPDPSESVPTRPARGRPVEAVEEPEDDSDDTNETDARDESDADSREDERSSRRSRGRGRRRRGRNDDADEASSGDAQSNARGEQRDSDEDQTDEEASDSGDGEDDDSGRRRRRRGGRGRRRSGEREDSDGSDGGSDDGSDDEDEETSGDATDGADSDDSGESGSGRRRRRRRRGSSGADSDDPPGTVTKVREPRSDTATGIKGSTRLEAKRQRRREGREAGRRRTIITEAEFLARRESVERVMVVRERGEHTQIGVLEDGILVEHYISGGGTAHGAAGAPGASMAGNVYLGRVQNVLPSMEAAFVDIGRGRNAVLYAGEVNWDAAGLEQHKARRIENALSAGQSVVVQVTKDPIGHKGARLTSQVSLPGRYLVYVPDGSMTGISRKLPDTERARLKKILKQIVPEDAGVIVRTAAEGASEAELTADVERLQRAWQKIQKKAKTGNAPVLLHGEVDLTTRVVRDVFNEDFAKLVVAGGDAWESISDYVDSVAPDLADRLHKWTGEKDVFAEYRVDEQIAKAMDRKVWLPSGGSLVIDRTEAMTVVDVNTGKFTGSGGNLEETVTKNNIEAAEEIVRQLRLRDIGGIIVIDFIDMVLESNRELVVRRLVECLGRDRTKHQVAEVTSLGLVQMTRKRVGAGLIEVFSEPCEHCNGRGIVISNEPLDRGESSGTGRSGNDDKGDRSDRGDRGRGRGRRGKGSGDSRPEPQTPPTPSGPTPAQIAAAAYAAAVQSHENDDAKASSGDAPMETAAVEAIIDEHLADTAPVPTSDDGDPGTTASADNVVTTDLSNTAAPRRRGSRRASSPTVAPTGSEEGAPVTAVEAPVSGRITGRVSRRSSSAPPESDTQSASPVAVGAADDAPAQSATPVEAPKRRRGARRAASAPVASPTGAEAVVFTASEVTEAAEPLTAAAGGASATTFPESGVQSATGVETTRGETSAPAPPKRRRAARRAAGSPAGPPSGSGE